MASKTEARPENVAGDFFVDDSCIDCDACRWIAPATFDEAGDQSRVHRQPTTDAERHRALMALVACPTASIGTREKHAMEPVLASFPEEIADGVHWCGYHDEQSFGAATYLVVRPEGNVLIDSPRFAKPLVRRIEALGGVRTLFLTHKDDVADHARWAAHFGAERVLHRDDVTRGTRDVERQIEGLDPVALDGELTVIPVPGHTRGSACLLWRDTFLFTGDHVAWSPDLRQIYAFRSACWYDWNALRASMERLARFRFEWILPGHGRRCHFPADEMAREMERCLAWLARTG
jgi:glyoxylase-like metal-dependent hydrolase (beta-lactamase superfamily II)/ferredoxin